MRPTIPPTAPSSTAKAEIIENYARTFEQPLLLRSMSQVGPKENPLAVFSPPNPKPEILDVPAPFPIISVLTVEGVYLRWGAV